MSRIQVLRALISGGSVLVIVAAMSPLAVAGSTQGNSGSHGKKSGISVPSAIPGFPGGFNGEKGLENKSTKLQDVGNSLEAKARALLKKQTGRKGSANPAIAAAQAAYKSARDTAITAFQTSTKSARDAYQVVAAPASVTQKAAYLAARTALQTALASAATDQAKHLAKDAYKAALKLADDGFISATASALATYKVAVISAQQVLNTALQAANLAFQQALAAVSNVLPSPNATPSPTPTP
jgi:hypothetical protein